MANEQNLKPFGDRTKSEQREIARQGGKASAEARRKKRDLRIALELLLEKNYKDKNGKDVTGTEALTSKLFEQAMKGNVRAFETLRDTIGQKPIDKVMISEVDVNVVEEVESAVLDE